MSNVARLIFLVIPFFALAVLASAPNAVAQGVGTVLGIPNSLTPSCAHTFYIDFESGNDVNPGTKLSPWKSHPYMQSWKGRYSHTAGDCFIFKGGIIWPAAAFTMRLLAPGIAGAYDYYGVDQKWFTGRSWTRPIFDAEDTAPSNIHMVHIPCDSGGFPGAYITIDSFELRGLLIDSASAAASILLSNCHDVMINNANIHGWRMTSNGGAKDANNRGGVGHGVSSGTSIANTVVQNSLIHDEEGCLRANIIQASRSGNIATVTVSPEIMSNWTAATGSTKIVVNGVSDKSFNTNKDVQNTTSVSRATFSYHNVGPDVGTFATSGTVKSACGISIQYIQTVANNVVHDTATFLLHGGQDVHDNYVYDNWGTYCNCGSTNNMFIDAWDGTITPTHDSYVYRNTIINSNLGTSYYPVPCTNGYTGVTMYFFDNLMVWHDTHPSNYAVNVDPIHCGLTADVSVYILNNTFRLAPSDTTACGRVTPRPGNRIANLIYKNNHCIFDGVIPYNFDGEHLKNSALMATNRVETNISATTNGYKESNLFMPTSAISPTVNAGVNLTSLCSGTLTALCFDLGVRSRPASGDWNIGAKRYPRPSYPGRLIPSVSED